MKRRSFLYLASLFPAILKGPFASSLSADTSSSVPDGNGSSGRELAGPFYIEGSHAFVPQSQGGNSSKLVSLADIRKVAGATPTSENSAVRFSLHKLQLGKDIWQSGGNFGVLEFSLTLANPFEIVNTRPWLPIKGFTKLTRSLVFEAASIYRPALEGPREIFTEIEGAYLVAPKTGRGIETNVSLTGGAGDKGRDWWELTDEIIKSPHLAPAGALAVPSSKESANDVKHACNHCDIRMLK